MPSKLSINHCKKLAEKRNGECLSDTYIDSKAKYKWKCASGHIWEAPYTRIKSGHWCPRCAAKKKVEWKRLSIDHCVALAKKQEGKCLSTEYISSDVIYEWQCKYGHIWTAAYKDINRGHWCPECAGKKKHTTEDCHRLAKQKNGKFLSEEYVNSKTKYKWQCKCGHIGMSTYGNFKRRSACSECYDGKKRGIGDCKKLAAKNNGECLSPKYKNSKTKLDWRCSRGHVWSARYNEIQQGTWCPKCCFGKSQEKLKKILEKVFDEKAKTIRPDWLKNPETKRNLEIDIYFPKLKLAIEYQGRHHYAPVCFGGVTKEKAQSRLKETKHRDEIKRKLIAKAKEWVFWYIEIKYTEQITDDNILELLLENGIIKDNGEINEKNDFDKFDSQ